MSYAKDGGSRRRARALHQFEGSHLSKMTQQLQLNRVSPRKSPKKF